MEISWYFASLIYVGFYFLECFGGFFGVDFYEENF
jgi:hypothetical protein